MSTKNQINIKRRLHFIVSYLFCSSIFVESLSSSIKRCRYDVTNHRQKSYIHTAYYIQIYIHIYILYVGGFRVEPITILVVKQQQTHYHQPIPTSGPLYIKNHIFSSFFLHNFETLPPQTPNITGVGFYIFFFVGTLVSATAIYIIK